MIRNNLRAFSSYFVVTIWTAVSEGGVRCGTICLLTFGLLGWMVIQPNRDDLTVYNLSPPHYCYYYCYCYYLPVRLTTAAPLNYNHCNYHPTIRQSIG